MQELLKSERHPYVVLEQSFRHETLCMKAVQVGLSGRKAPTVYRRSLQLQADSSGL
jgi:hypothetical protein